MGEFECGYKAGLLVQAAELAGGVDDLVFFLESFASRSLNSHQYVTRVYPSDTKETSHFLCHISLSIYFEILQN